MERAKAVRSTRPALWRDIRVLRALGQAVFVVLLVLVFREVAQNFTTNLRAQGQTFSFDFLRARAGFGISEGIPYSPNESFRKAFLVGLVNTIRVAGMGIVLATILGLVMGVARLSPNWLLRKIAQVYVEAIRNTPVLVQIIFWFFGVIAALPPIQDAATWGSVAVFSNRANAVALPRTAAGAGTWGLFLLAGLVAAALVWRWRTRVQDRTGEAHRRVLWSMGVFVCIAAVGYVVADGPVRIDTPEVVGRRVVGGVQLSPAYTALLLGLVVYTGAFIAEIVRGSILAVSKGQKEAAEALGLTRFEQLRFVVLPQAMRVAIPPINSQYLNLTKNSSLGVAIGFADVTSVARTIANQAGRATQILLITMLAYLILSLTISFFMNLINRAVTVKGGRA